MFSELNWNRERERELQQEFYSSDYADCRRPTTVSTIHGRTQPSSTRMPSRSLYDPEHPLDVNTFRHTQQSGVSNVVESSLNVAGGRPSRFDPSNVSVSRELYFSGNRAPDDIVYSQSRDSSYGSAVRQERIQNFEDVQHTTGNVWSKPRESYAGGENYGRLSGLNANNELEVNRHVQSSGMHSWNTEQPLAQSSNSQTSFSSFPRQLDQPGQNYRGSIPPSHSTDFRTDLSGRNSLHTAEFQGGDFVADGTNRHTQQNLQPTSAATFPYAPEKQQTPSEQDSSPAIFRRKVTHVDDQIGFAGTDLFFQMSKVVGTVPKLGSWVIVKAERVNCMPFNWNALWVEVEQTETVSQPRTFGDTITEQIPLLLPSLRDSTNAESSSRPIKSILKNKPPPPPVISHARENVRQPSPESPLVVYEKVQKKKLSSPNQRSRKYSKSPPRRSRDVSDSHRERDVRTRLGSPANSKRRIHPRRESSCSVESVSSKTSSRRSSRSPRRGRTSGRQRNDRSRSHSRNRRSRSHSKTRRPRRHNRTRSSRSHSRTPRSRSHSRTPRSRSHIRTRRSRSHSRTRGSRSHSRTRRSRSPRVLLSISPQGRRRRSRSSSPCRSELRRNKQFADTQKLKSTTEHEAQKKEEMKEKPVPLSFSLSKKDSAANQASKIAAIKKSKAKQEQMPAYRLVRTAVNDIKKQMHVEKKEIPPSETEDEKWKRTKQRIEAIKADLQAAVQAKKSTTTNPYAISSAPPVTNTVPLQNNYYSHIPYTPTEPILYQTYGQHTMYQHPQPFPVPQPVAYSPPVFEQPYYGGPYQPPANFTPTEMFSQNKHSSHQPTQILRTSIENKNRGSTRFKGRELVSVVNNLEHSSEPAPPGEDIDTFALNNRQSQKAPRKLSAVKLQENVNSTRLTKSSSERRTSVTAKVSKDDSKASKDCNTSDVSEDECFPAKQDCNTSDVSEDECFPAKQDCNTSDVSEDECFPAKQDCNASDVSEDECFPARQDCNASDISDDEICTIYVKPPSALFEDAGESGERKIEQSTARETCSFDAEESSETNPNEFDDVIAMSPNTATSLGCHQDYLSEAKSWMICVRCAKRGHLHHMCDKERVPRALPFEISMARALLKDMEKNYSQDIASRSSSKSLHPKKPSGTSEAGEGTKGRRKAAPEDFTEATEVRKDRKTVSTGRVGTNPVPDEQSGSSGCSSMKDDNSTTSDKYRKVNVVKPQTQSSETTKDVKTRTSQSRSVEGGRPDSSSGSKSVSYLAQKLSKRAKQGGPGSERVKESSHGSGGNTDERSSRTVRSSSRHSESVFAVRRRRSLSSDQAEDPVVHIEDPMRAVEVKQLEIQSLELRERELEQQMKLILVEQQRLDQRRSDKWDSDSTRGSLPESSRSSDLFCYICLGKDHSARVCRAPCPSWIKYKRRVSDGTLVEEKPGVLESFCLACGKIGQHFTRDCRNLRADIDYSDVED